MWAWGISREGGEAAALTPSLVMYLHTPPLKGSRILCQYSLKTPSSSPMATAKKPCFLFVIVTKRTWGWRAQHTQLTFRAEPAVAFIQNLLTWLLTISTTSFPEPAQPQDPDPSQEEPRTQLPARRNLRKDKSESSPPAVQQDIWHSWVARAKLHVALAVFNHIFLINGFIEW